MYAYVCGTCTYECVRASVPCVHTCMHASVSTHLVGAHVCSLSLNFYCLACATLCDWVVESQNMSVARYNAVQSNGMCNTISYSVRIKALPMDEHQHKFLVYLAIWFCFSMMEIRQVQLLEQFIVF